MKAFVFIFLGIFSSFINAQQLYKKNLEGQKYLFNEGWYIIPSAKDSWQYFKKKSLESSGEAMAKALREIKESKASVQSLSSYLKHAKNIDSSFSELGSDFGKSMYALAHKVEERGKKQSKQLTEKMYHSFVLGYAEYGKKTAEQRQRLRHFFENYFTDYKKRTAQLDEGFVKLKEEYIDEISVDWHHHFMEAKNAFQQEYKKSGTRKNSLMGLWDILIGYGRTFFHGILSPSAKETKNTAKKSSYYITKGIVNVATFTGSFLYSTGLNLYAAGEVGYHIIAPSVEAGFLGVISVFSYVGTKTGEYGLKTMGGISQYTVQATGKLAAAGDLVINPLVDTTKTVAVGIYEFGKGSAYAVAEAADGAIVLGYTALMQLPPQVLLTAINSTFVLAWDGAEIVIAKVTGESIQGMPTGTVVDLKELKEKGYEVEPLEIDEKAKKNILENIR